MASNDHSKKKKNKKKKEKKKKWDTHGARRWCRYILYGIRDTGAWRWCWRIYSAWDTKICYDSETAV